MSVLRYRQGKLILNIVLYTIAILRNYCRQNSLDIADWLTLFSHDHLCWSLLTKSEEGEILFVD